jgi:hypothetical protein
MPDTKRLVAECALNSFVNLVREARFEHLFIGEMNA